MAKKTKLKGGNQKSTAHNRNNNPSSQAAVAKPPSKKRKSNNTHNRPVSKKQKPDGNPFTTFHKNETFCHILTALNQSHFRQDNERLNTPLSKTKFGSLVSALSDIQTRFPGTNQGTALLAVVVLDDQFRVTARKAMDICLGAAESSRWLNDARTHVQHFLTHPQTRQAVTGQQDPVRRNSTERNSAQRDSRSLSDSHPLDDGADYASDEAPSIGTVRSSIRRDSVPSVGDANPRDQEDGEIIVNIEPSGGLKLWQLPLADQELQIRYFGITDPNELVYCRNCLKRGHINTTDSCPALSCAICHTVSHDQRHCPQTQKCLRCRRRGHTSDQCSHQSVPAGGVGDECDICGKLGHTEGECSYLWHVYRPTHDTVPQIRASDMRVFCYSCGSQGHWGGDCVRSTTHDGQGIPWSFTAAHAAMYIMSEDQPADDSDQKASNGYIRLEEDGLLHSGGLPAWQLRQLSDYV